MKIAIITLFGLTNYGNRLQNYAMHRVLEAMGHQPESIVADSLRARLWNTVLLYLDKRNGHLVLRDGLERARMRRFRAFLRQYTPTRIVWDKDRRFRPVLEKDYDCFLVGSDQVWNPLFWEKEGLSGAAGNYLLTFVSRKKKLAYAASFGIPALDEKYTELFRTGLSGFDAISVREEAAQRLLAEDFGLSAELVLDPTLLLGCEDWRGMEKGIVDGNEKFIAVYFLGEQPEEVWAYLRRTAAEIGARIVTIADERDPETYKLGPEGFLELLDKAALCFTDSFHACVFSLLFHTPFVVYKRRHRNQSDMSSRIDTLLKTVRMEERLCTGDAYPSLWDCRFEESDALLAKARERSRSILRRMLDAPAADAGQND